MSLRLCISCNYLTTPSNAVSNESAYRTRWSTYSNFLRSNVSLDDMTKGDVRSLLTDLLSRLGDIDHEISRLEDLLDHARRERAAISSSIDLCRAVSAPIRSLPNEMLSDIFYATIPPLDTSFMSMACMPWAASQVCSRWRSIALSTPRLWSYVSVSVYEETNWGDEAPGPSNAERRLQVLSSRLPEYLARSMNASLCIDINIQVVAITTSSVARQILEQLVTECARWEVARLTLGLNDCQGILSKVKGRLPRLHSLHFTSIFSSSDIDFFYIAPRLHYVNVSYASSRTVPWSQITRLVILPVMDGDGPGLPFNTFSFDVRVLGLCTQLEELVVNSPPFGSIQSSTVNFKLNLPSLLHLDCHPQFCSAITAPTLQSLRLTTLELDSENNDGAAIISQFLERSACQLQHCHLISVFRRDIVDIIQLVAPFLTQIDIYLNFGWSGNMDTEHIDRLNQIHVPRLQILEVDVASTVAELLPLWIPVIQSWKNSSPLLKTSIRKMWHRGMVQVKVVEDVLAELRQNGIEVELQE